MRIGQALAILHDYVFSDKVKFTTSIEHLK